MSENYSLSTKINEDQQKKFQEVVDAIPSILTKLKNLEYDEIYGYRINAVGIDYVQPLQRNEILLKFIIANEYDVEKSIAGIVKTLDWRSKFQPLRAAFEENFDKELNDLGVITDFQENGPNLKVVTWNLYGNLKSPEKLFAKFAGTKGESKDAPPGSPFLRWRIGIMEKSLQLIDFTDVENNKIAQIHDYNGASMFRMDPGMKAASKEIIAIFQDNYPELLSIKLFVNVPYIMGWVFTFFKVVGVIGAATLAKFQMLNHGDLREWFKKAPAGYGGTEGDIFSLDVASKLKLSEYGKVLLLTDSKEVTETPDLKAAVSETPDLKAAVSETPDLEAVAVSKTPDVDASGTDVSQISDSKTGAEQEVAHLIKEKA